MKIYEYESVVDRYLECGIEKVNEMARQGWRVCGFVMDDVACWTLEREVKQPKKKVKPTKMPSHGAPR